MRKKNKRSTREKLADVFMEIQDSDPNEQGIILAGYFNRDPNDQEAS